MDSANSGSLQSSSGGDDEYDSRAADFISSSSGGVGGVPISHNHHPPQYFNPLPNYLQLHQNPNSTILNSNLSSWPRSHALPTPPLRSDPNPYPIGGGGAHDAVHSMFPSSNHYMPCFQPGMRADSGSGAPVVNQTPHAAAARNPKKRSRASRRAPTTVLTTDTTNFRAMVQEFTGIPAPPFHSTSYPRSRLDFFGSRSAASEAAQPPPYLRRPFPQKAQPLFTSAALDAIAASTAPTNNNTTGSAAAAASNNYQLPMTQSSSSNLFNISNQSILTSLLQSNPKFPFSTTSIVNDHFTLPHSSQATETLAAALPSLIPSNHNNGGDSGRWSSNQGGDFERNIAMSGGKIGFSATSTAETAAVRGEGMVESWICSSE